MPGIQARRQTANQKEGMMSNNRMLALVAILAGGLMVGGCADNVTGPWEDDGGVGQRPAVPIVTLPDEALLNYPEGYHHERGLPRGGDIE
mgnify:CR=1 FL=1